MDLSWAGISAIQVSCRVVKVHTSILHAPLVCTMYHMDLFPNCLNVCVGLMVEFSLDRALAWFILGFFSLACGVSIRFLSGCCG